MEHSSFHRPIPLVVLNIMFSIRNYFFFTGDRTAGAFNTRLRLNFSALKCYLFKRNCSVSSACALCDATIEDTKHSFLLCPSFAAFREILLTPVSHLFGASDKRKIDWILNGVPGIEFQLNVNLFLSVQSFISELNRFS